MSIRRLALTMALALPWTSCGRPAVPAPTTKSYLPPQPASESRTEVVIRKEYGGRGSLAVEMTESPLPNNFRAISYSFQLISPDGKSRRELSATYFADPHPVGSGNPDGAVIDAEWTAGDVLVTVEYGMPDPKLDPDLGPFGSYGADVRPARGSPLVVPWSAYRKELYNPSGPEPQRRAKISGSLEKKDLTVSLVGHSNTLRFRFVLFENDQIGWFSLPENKIAEPRARMAAVLPGPASAPATQPAAK